MPDQQRQQAETLHEQPGHDAGQAHFHAADPERLVRIPGVTEAPDEGRKDDRREAGAHQSLQKGNGERARKELFGERRKEPGEDDGHPRQGTVEQVVVRHLRRRPRTVPMSGQVEDHLIGDEERHERVAEDMARKTRREESARGVQRRGMARCRGRRSR